VEEIITIEDYVDEHCMRHMHLMSNMHFDDPQNIQHLFTFTTTPVEFKRYAEAGVFHLKASWRYCGVLDVQAEGWPKFRRLVVWPLEGCATVREAIEQAFIFFWATFKFQPAYVFMRKLPRDVEHGTPIALWALPPNAEGAHLGEEDEMILLKTEWMLERCVAVGGRR
jgi:hypothetical protein